MFSYMMTAFTALLFVFLTPGIFVTFPSKGSKWVVALVHGILFALIYHITHKAVWHYFMGSSEHFAVSKMAKDKVTDDFDRSLYTIKQITKLAEKIEKEATDKTIDSQAKEIYGRAENAYKWTSEAKKAYIKTKQTAIAQAKKADAAKAHATKINKP